MATQDLDRHVAEMVAIKSGSSAQRISPLDVLRWSGSLEDHDYFNAASLNIARKYYAGALSYSVCDGIMNDLWRILIYNFQGGMVPSPFFEIYEAFDAGEYHRTPDRTDDPEQEHTFPMIQEILSEFPITP